MKACLRDRTLLLLAAGEGAAQHRAHLKGCLSCARQYQHFARNLAAIEQTLRETSPLQVSAQGFLLPSRQWLPLATALTVILLLIWSGVWIRSPHPQPERTVVQDEAPDRFRREETAPSFLAEKDTLIVAAPTPGSYTVYLPFFAEKDILIVAAPAPVSHTVYLQAALNGGWPCEWREPFPSPVCEVHPFPFFLEE